MLALAQLHDTTELSARARFHRIKDDILVTFVHVVHTDAGEVNQIVRGRWQHTHLWNYRFVTTDEVSRELLELVLEHMELQGVVYNAQLNPKYRHEIFHMASISVR
jgi:hypothetical protein